MGADPHGFPAPYRHRVLTQPSAGEEGCGVQPVPLYLGYSGKDMSVLCPACNLSAPSLQLCEDTGRSVPSAVRIQQPVPPDNPSRDEGNTSYYFVTQQRRCLPSSGFTEAIVAPPAPIFAAPRSFLLHMLFHNHTEFTSGPRSLAIINHALSIPSLLHCTCTFAASWLLSGRSGFSTARPRASPQHCASRPA